jgi:hypothetical protein
MAAKNKFTQEAELYEGMRDNLGRDQLENFKYMKSQLADWYIAIAAVCFAIGGIAISTGKNITAHPALFWWASVLLIANGVLIFFAKKVEIESESSGFTELKQKEADLWTMSKIAREHAAGDNSRSDEFMGVAKRFVQDYDTRSEALKWWQWVKFSAHTSLLDIVFGLLLFPILMLAPQLPNYLDITFKTYTYLLWLTLVIYLIYMVFQAAKAIREKKKSNAAAQQIKAEVDKNRANYDKAKN